ncbi:RNA helicase [Bertholletia excelsa]
MPVQLLPHLRLLNNSLYVAPFSTMKLFPHSRRSSGAIPAFSRIFSCKLKYQCLSWNLGTPAQDETLTQQLGVRPFSTRSGRPRAASGEVRASRSLIEDEAELSDWVSGLRSDSFRARLYSGSDEDNESARGKGRSTDTRRSRDERGGRNRISTVKRRRDSDFDDYPMSNRQKGRDSFMSSSRKLRGTSRFATESEEEDEGFASRGRDNGRRRDMNSKLSKRGARSSELRFGHDKAGNRHGELKGGENSLFRGKFLTSDEDIENGEEGEKGLTKNFRDFMDEEDSEEGEDEDSDDGDMLKNARTSFAAGKETSEKITASSPGRSDSYLSETRFDQCSVSPSSLKGIKDAGYERMTVVQEATLPIILKGKDVLAKAKTGTGKTVAFLLPSIEVIVKSPPLSSDQKRPPILVLVICPTRELASQAAAEADTLLKYHPSISVQIVIGGTRLALEQKRMQANPCQILVATPGRLRDHIENTPGFATRLMGVKVLVLDEADHLLDMGFRRDIEHIIAAVPKQRQTLLFSATVPEQVRQICHIALKRDHEFIDTVGQGSEETHSQVRQLHLVAPLDKHFSILYTLLKDHIADDVDYKVLVFCTTAMVTRFVADLLGELNLNVREIHSRKPQSYRTRISDEFRKSKGLFL